MKKLLIILILLLGAIYLFGRITSVEKEESCLNNKQCEMNEGQQQELSFAIKSIVIL